MITEIKQNGNRDERPLSPCVLICTLDEAKQCLGCGRTLAEISAWATLSIAEQWQIVDALTTRNCANAATIPAAKGD